MRDNESKSTNSGIGFNSLLLLLFIGLKLGGVINWSWWWVLSPIWIPLLIILFILLAYLIFIILRKFFDKNN